MLTTLLLFPWVWTGATNILPASDDTLEVEKSTLTNGPEVGKSILLPPGVPQDYIKQIKDLLKVEVATSSTDDFYNLGWLEKDEHQIAENPDGLNRITRVIAKIQEAGNIATRFDGSNILNLPFGIRGHFGDLPFMIGFDNIQLHTNYASVDVVASLYMPFLGDTLYFVAAGLKYNNRAGFIGEARLRLVQDFVVGVNPQKSAVIFRGYRNITSMGTYIDIDCDGITGVSFGMDFSFNPDFIKPVNSTQRFVRAYTEFSYDRDHGFLADDLSIAPFYFKDFKDVAFSLEDLSIDFDETKTAVSYIQEYLDQVGAVKAVGISADQWTGFYCKNFQLIIGNKYITHGSGKPVVVEGHNIVIDDLGFTAQVSVHKDLLSLDEGLLHGWSFSIDRVNLGILANRFDRFGFGGLIHLPILDQKKDGPKEIGDLEKEVSSGPTNALNCLKYEANYLVDSSMLSFRVQKLDSNDFSVPMLFADINILAGSYLQLVTGKDHRIEAYLNANLSFDGKLDQNSSITTPDILFEGLYLSNRPPYLSVKQIHPVKEDSSKLGKYSFTFENILIDDEEPEKHGGQLKRLTITNLQLNLGEIINGDAMQVTSSLDVFFGVSPEGSKHKWTGRGIRVNQFGFKGTLPGIDHLEGELAFYRNDRIYGTGFYGGGLVRFGFMNADVKMMCQFGTTGDAGFHYSFVDAALDFDEPPAKDQAFGINMLIAGYHKNMIREDLTEFEVGDGMTKVNEDLTPLLGGQYSENRFVPSEHSMGIRGGLVAKVGEGALLGVRIIHERHHSEQQGLSSRFFFEGLVELMPKSDIQDSPVRSRMASEGEVEEPFDKNIPNEFMGSGAFGGYVRLDMTKTKDGNTFNAALGIHGQVGPIGVAFYGEYYKSPDSWHLFIGTPTNRVGLSYGEELSDVVSASIGIFGYFMIGNSDMMPGELPEPYALTPTNKTNLRIAFDSLRQNPTTNIFSAGSVDLGAGNAIALGVGIGLRAAINIPDAERRWLFVDAGADIGFDLLLMRSRPECNRMNVSQIGFNNWYLYGQMYAGIAASVGFVIKKRMLKIFDGSASVLLTGAGFGPTWGVGTWRLQYQFLWKKGEAQGIFKFGQPCNNINSSFDPSRILEQVYPSRPIAANPGSSVDEIVVGINSDFRMNFAMAADRKTQQSVVDFENGETEYFYAHLVSDVSLMRDDGTLIEGDKMFDQGGRTMIFRPKQMLTPGEVISLHLKSTVFDDQGIYYFDGQAFSVDTTIYYYVDPNGTFGLTTDDIALSYPMINQQYFHKDEFDQMMISYGKDLPLQTGMTLNSYLFKSDDGNFIKVEESKCEIDKIGIVQNTFNSLENSNLYRWILRVTSGAGKSADIATIDFATSKYALFSDKVKNASIVAPAFDSEGNDVTLPLVVLSSEPLESFSGNVNTAFIANQMEDEAPSPTAGDIKDLKGTKNKIVNGTAYLSRAFSTFKPTLPYDYFQEIYEGHIPYGSTVEINCIVDDGSPDDQIKAKPADAVQYHKMEAWTDKLLSLDKDTIWYNILEDFRRDHFDFLTAKPSIPPYYVDCENYSKGNIPYYKPSLYVIKLRYYLPGFEHYSATSINMDFRIEE